MSYHSNRDLEEREHRNTLIAAGGWPEGEPDQPAPKPAVLPTPAQRATTAAACVPAEADAPFFAGNLYIADPSLAAYVREQLAARAARDEARRREYLASHPVTALEELREGLDAVAAQDFGELEAA